MNQKRAIRRYQKSKSKKLLKRYIRNASRAGNRKFKNLDLSWLLKE